jgi:hypothetical protein
MAMLSIDHQNHKQWLKGYFSYIAPVHLCHLLCHLLELRNYGRHNERVCYTYCGM